VGQFLVNFGQFLGNWLPVALTESDLPLPQNHVFQNCPVVAKNQCPDKKNLCPKHNPAQKSTILHNLHNFRTILLKRQWAALFESKQIQAQKDGFPHLCTIYFPICARKKSPTQTPPENKF
jgi:hypothetical protein